LGQKVHPFGFRLGYNRTWKSRWFAKKDYGKLLHEDLQIKKNLKKRFSHAGVSRIEIERAANKLTIFIYTSRPGIIIGRKGSEIDKLKTDLQAATGREVFINIQEINKPELDAQLVAESIAQQLEKRVAFRRAMRRAVDTSLRFGARGIKVRCGGRLNGAEIARSEWYLHGQLPLHTLRADIDYGFAEAHTTYGVIGVKSWIYTGDIFDVARDDTRPTRDKGRERREERREGRPRPSPESGGPAGGRGGRAASQPRTAATPAAPAGPAVEKERAAPVVESPEPDVAPPEAGGGPGEGEKS
jgi:small subunit ribosomal protein S3